MVWCKQSCRRRFGTCANGQLRFPKNLGESCFCSSAISRLEIPGYQLQALAVHSSGKERKQRVAPRYRQAKETKCGEMAVGCRSTLIVLMKPGNWSRRTRWREGKTERGCLMLDAGSGNTSEASYLESRITDTAQDSIPGMQRCCMANPSLEEPDALCGAGAYVAVAPQVQVTLTLQVPGRNITIPVPGHRFLRCQPWSERSSSKTSMNTPSRKSQDYLVAAPIGSLSSLVMWRPTRPETTHLSRIQLFCVSRPHNAGRHITHLMWSTT